ncbi:hypothetical protein D6C99_10091 [Aureobasidium pullulans]|nr:hypothetical protein D6C99_10091 [Aureobasidium pullulans]
MELSLRTTVGHRRLTPSRYLKAGRESHGLPHEDLLLTTCLRTLVNHKSKALRSYSTTYWGSHLDTSSKATCLPVESRGLFETFLVEDEHLEVWLDDLDALLETESYLHGELVRKLRRGASALYLAACWGVCDLVQLLIDQKVDVNIAGGRFGSALQVAAHNGHREVVRLLLRHGAEPRGSEYFPDPMSAAVAGGHGNMVRFMLGNGLRFTDRQSFAACRDLALFDGQAELVRFLLDRFPEHFKPEEHEDQLQAALYARKEKMVRELIDGQIDVEKQTGPFGNALQAAICGGKLDLVELIINSGADLNCRGRYGYPLRAAVIFEHEEIVHWLLENKQADANIADNDLGDCLQAAAFKGNTRLMKLLLDHGARVEPCRTELKQSLGGVYGIPLHAAAAAGHHNAVELLMERGADVGLE